MLTGLTIALLVAVAQSTRDIFFSGERIKTLPHLIKAIADRMVFIPTVGLIVVIRGFPEIHPEFWVYVALHAGLIAIESWLYMRALALASVSQTQPILALSIVFLVVTTPLMTDDKVSVVGWIGVLLIGLGIYAAQHPGRNSETGQLPSFWAPFWEMLRQPGIRSKLGVALIHAMTSNLDKLCMQTADSPTYLLVDSILIVVILGWALAAQRMVALAPTWAASEEKQARMGGVKTQPISAVQGWVQATRGGFATLMVLLLQLWALQYTAVPYVIAIKRLSIIFVSCWGFFVRRDRRPNWYRLAGMVLVVAGVVTIILFG